MSICTREYYIYILLQFLCVVLRFNSGVRVLILYQTSNRVYRRYPHILEISAGVRVRELNKAFMEFPRLRKTLRRPVAVLVYRIGK